VKRTRKVGKRQPAEIVTARDMRVPIYRKPVGEYDSFLVSYYAGGKRIQKRAATLDKARAIARDAIRQLTEGAGRQITTLSPDELADYLAAKQAARRLDGSHTLASIVGDYVSAVCGLPRGATLRDAATYYAKHAGRIGEKARTSVADVAAAFIKAKESEELSQYYIKPIRRILDRFATDFQCPIGSVQPDEIRAWIVRQNVAKRTRNNLRNALATLFSFARTEGYLPDADRTAAERVPTERVKDTTISTYTAAELRAILAHTPGRLIPALAIAAFAGIRSAEILRLDWRNVKLTEGHIELGPEITKTASRRVVPIQPALAAWLAPHAKSEGSIALAYQNLDNLTRQMIAAVMAANVTPKRNGFRHSFGTYRLAVTQNAAQTSLEMGNSPAKLMRNYNAAATVAQGEAWFAVCPPRRARTRSALAAAARPSR
jgi:integrase